MVGVKGKSGKRIENPSTKLLQKRESRLRHRHPCIDCGEPCDGRGQRCKRCFFEHLRNGRGFNWKGGKSKYGDYIVIWMPEHHRANKGGYVLEHILVWEQAHDKPLPKGWIIHHLNGIKDDNHPQNLEGLPNKKHYLVLQAKAKRIQELEALLNGQSQLL